MSRIDPAKDARQTMESAESRPRKVSDGASSEEAPAVTSASFRRERDLVEAVQTVIPQLLRVRSGQDVRVLTDVPIGSVIPDILVGIWRSHSPSIDLRLTYVEAHLLAAVERLGPMDLKTLLTTVHVTEAAALRAVARLTKAGAVIQRKNGKIAVRRKYPLGDVELVAVEAKLRRWRDALRQAREYQSFANRTYVVLDEGQVRSDPEMLRAFEAASVGLWLRTTSTTSETVAAPRLAPISADRIQALQKLAALQRPASGREATTNSDASD